MRAGLRNDVLDVPRELLGLPVVYDGHEAVNGDNDQHEHGQLPAHEHEDKYVANYSQQIPEQECHIIADG